MRNKTRFFTALIVSILLVSVVYGPSIPLTYSVDLSLNADHVVYSRPRGIVFFSTSSNALYVRNITITPYQGNTLPVTATVTWLGSGLFTVAYVYAAAYNRTGDLITYSYTLTFLSPGSVRTVTINLNVNYEDVWYVAVYVT